jgi:hypothetical protein
VSPCISNIDKPYIAFGNGGPNVSKNEKIKEKAMLLY